MNITAEMSERIKRVDGAWSDEGDGYASMIGHGGFARVAYVAIPTTHPDCRTDYGVLDVDVNGGLTFAEGNVFGWDYGHGFNRYDYRGDIDRALAFFRGREARGDQS